jgi:chromosomal replication initiator protein
MQGGEIWARAREELSKRVSPEVYRRWFEVIEPVGPEGKRFRLLVPNDFYMLWLEENYAALIASALRVVTGQDWDVQFSTREAQAQPTGEPSASSRSTPELSRPAPRRDSVSTPLDPSFTFSTFVLGPSNAFAHAACMAVAQAPGHAYNPLLIFGGSGLGKTHLMQAIGHHVLKASRSSVVCYTSAESFLNEYIEALQHNRMVTFRKKYRGVDVLLIDDVHFLAGKNGLQEEFFHMFNELHNRGRQIVLTCDRAPADIQGIDKRLISRFEWGVTTQIEPPDTETRVAILRKKAELLKLNVSDDVIAFIAEHIRNNIRKMEGALKSVAAYAMLQGTPMTVEMARQVLRGYLDRTAGAPPSIETIQKAVADFFDVRISDLTGRRRLPTVVMPRQVAMYLCRTLTGSSLPAIGEAFGKNHATVLHACRLVSERIRHDPAFAETIATLRRRLGAD